MGKIGGKKKKTAAKEEGKKNTAGQDSKQADGMGGLSSNMGGPKLTAGQGFNENDIEFMKKAIQVLCQSTNPLGKSIDFVTDDIESMGKEYEQWRKEQVNSQSQLEEQQRITEECLQPLHDQLAELEEKIKDQQSKVNSTKSQIMRNDITISNLLYSVISSK